MWSICETAFSDRYQYVHRSGSAGMRASAPSRPELSYNAASAVEAGSSLRSPTTTNQPRVEAGAAEALVDDLEHPLGLAGAESVRPSTLLGALRVLRLQVVDKQGQPTTAERDLDLEAVTREQPRPLRVIRGRVELIDMGSDIEDLEARKNGNVDLAKVPGVDQQRIRITVAEMTLVERTQGDQALHLLQHEHVRQGRAVPGDRPCSELPLDRREQLKQIRVIHRQIAKFRIVHRALARLITRERPPEPIPDEQVVGIERAKRVRHARPTLLLTLGSGVGRLVPWTARIDLDNLEHPSKLGLVEVPRFDHRLRVLPADEQVDHVADHARRVVVSCVVAGVRCQHGGQGEHRSTRMKACGLRRV